jgi:hypothetical protein
MPAPTKGPTALGLNTPLPPIGSAQQANPPVPQTTTPGIFASQGSTKWLPAAPSTPMPRSTTVVIGAQRQAAPTPAPTTNLQGASEPLPLAAPLPNSNDAKSTSQATGATVKQSIEDTRSSIAEQTKEGQQKDAAEAAHREILDKERKAELARAEQALHIQLPVATPGI